MDEHVEIGNIIEGDAGIQISDLLNDQISSSEKEKLSSSSEEEKLIISSSDDEKSRDSSEEDEKRKSVDYEKRKRQDSDDEEEAEYEEKKRQKYCRPGFIWSCTGSVNTCPPWFKRAYDRDEYLKALAVKDDDDDDDEDVVEKKVDKDENRDDVDSYFTREELESTEVKPEECQVKLTDEEQKFYIDDDYEGAWSRWATKAELIALDQRMEESEGFDVLFLPYSFYPGGTRRTNLSVKENVIRVVKCAKRAIEFYNYKNGSDFKFDRLVMSATTHCAGVAYSITFMATSESTEYTETFQTRAYVRYTGALHIMMCRIKTDNNQSLALQSGGGHLYKLTSDIMPKKLQ